MVGSAFAKYALAGMPADPLQVETFEMAKVSGAASAASVTTYPLFATPFDRRSGLMNPWLLPTGGLTRSARSMAYAPVAQVEAYAASALLISRSEAIAEASLPDIRARRRPGMAMAAMIPTMATTRSSSTRLNPP